MGGSKPLSDWIDHMSKCGVSLCKNNGLVVITVIGKDTTSTSKASDLNEAFGGSYFNSWGQRDLSCGSIEAFFCFDLEALFLVVNSYKDVTSFSSVSSSSNTEFFEWVRREESKMESQLAVAFSLSHLVLVIENACRIELTLLELLQNANRKRMELRDSMPEDVRLNSDNRFAVPRFLFALHRHLIRKDLGNSKRKEVLEKLEQSLEDQTFSIFKHYKLLSTAENNPEEALGHIWGEGYIHLMEKTNEVTTQHILSKLFSTLDGEIDEKEETDSNSNRFLSFLSSHIRKVREGKKLVNELPTHERFLACATQLLNTVQLISVENEEDEEEEFIHKLTALHLERAREKYMPSGTNMVLSRGEHEERMNAVFESLDSIRVNAGDNSSLKESFEAIWSCDLRSCEYRSLLGNGCRLAAHASIGDAVDREKWTLHSSSVTHISACNCGRSQMVRSDPFTLVEANRDFYAQFSCCERAMETHQFKLVGDESGRRVEGLDEEWPEVRIVGQIGERTGEEKREEEAQEREEEGGNDDGDGDEEEEEEEERTQTSQEDISADEKSYLEDEQLVVKSAKDAQLTKAIQEYDTLVRLRSEEIPLLEGVPHLDAPDVRPLFPSWSLVCIGTSSLYSHVSGIRGQYGFIGDTHLLPLDVYLEVDGAAWNRDMTYVESVIKSSSHLNNRNKRMRKGPITERVKLFIGMEYECSAGHRQLGMGEFDDGIHLVENDLPLYQPCSYRKTPCENAQMMRIHIVTPKAPVTVSINPKIIASETSPMFYPGESLDLSWSRYYILRLPWIYSGPDGVITRPSSPSHAGLLLSNSITVSYSPLSNW